MQTYDKLWKGIIEDLFEHFLEMFFPDLFKKIDFSKGFEFLDQELSQLFPDAEEGNRTVDKLAKVYLKTGKEEWILSHIEVQGYKELIFPKRMFTIFYRILDRFDKEVTALAIFTDKQKDFKPDRYKHSFYKTKILYQYRTYKVIEQDREVLLQSNNPFALVILATKIAIEKKKTDDEELMSIKWELARLLFERNYDKKVISSVFRFINFYIRFEKRENYSIFAKQIKSKFQNQRNNMGIVEILYEDARVEGRQEGLTEGRQEGRQEGHSEGLYLKTQQVVLSILTKFPDWTNEVIADLAQTDIDFVEKMRNELNTAA